MSSHVLSFTFPVLIWLYVAVSAQTPSVKPAVAPDYSQAPYVIEEMSSKLSFDGDGNRSREQVTRVRVQSDAGLQQWGLLSLPYQSASERVEVDYVRVRKADNSIVATPEDNVQDLDAEITRSAPFYSDLREKHVAVKGLGKGDVLEYQVSWHPIKPLIPGQFWFEYNFHHEGIVLDERLEIRVPAERAVKVKGPEATQAMKTDGAWRVYSWSHSKKEENKEAQSDKKKVEAVRGLIDPPDVQLSSFQSWEEVGEWYWKLQKERVEPSATVKAKAAELTKGLTDDETKLRALYNFVSTQYRYIGIAFGIGRYQPHTADDVLGNNYGDCKDKHTLLAALAEASSITLYPALINSMQRLDPDIPSPGQFNHVIGYLPQAKTAVWLDTTPEVGPYGYLMPSLREKPALVMLGDKEAKLATTPTDPPFSSLQTFKIEGKLEENGSFDAHVEDTMRGDNEILIRAAFRQVPQAQWKDLVQQISYGLGFAGTVSDVNASAPERSSDPFHFSYAYTRKDYPDWTNRQFTVPGLPFYMPQAKDDAKDPLWLGALGEVVSDAKVEVPKGYKPKMPDDVNLKYDFAEYHATYKQDQAALTCERRLIIKMHEIPVAELEDYRSFVKNMGNDLNRYVQTTTSEWTSTGMRVVGASTPETFQAIMADMKELDASDSDEANNLEAEARSAMAGSDETSAERSFKGAVAADPNFTRAWVELSTIYLLRGQNDAALDALRKAIDSDDEARAPRRMYAHALTFMRREQAALQAWKDLLKIAPDDVDANKNEAALLVQGKHYTEALPYLEAAAKVDASSATQIQLGTAYLKAGKTEQGTSSFQKVVETDTTPMTLNSVGYELADANVALPQALEYAQRAVEGQEKESHDLRLGSLLQEDLACTVKIGMFWDTLGWAEFRLGHLERAESYLEAAWLLSQNAVIGDHLGQVYEKENRSDKAVHMYRLAMATTEGRSAAGSDPEKHLEHLGEKPNNSGLVVQGHIVNSGVGNSGEELSRLRTVRLKRTIAGTGSAEFFLLFNGSSKPEEAVFVSGSEELRSATSVLPEVNFEVSFPSGSSARIVRRGILMCSKISGCNVVLYTPGSVR